MEIKEILLTTENVHLLTKEQAWHYRVLPKNGTDLRMELYCEAGAEGDSLAAELEVLLGKEVLLED